MPSISTQFNEPASKTSNVASAVAKGVLARVANYVPDNSWEPESSWADKQVDFFIKKVSHRARLANTRQQEHQRHEESAGILFVLPERSLQALRDEIRAMVEERRPQEGIPLYKGQRNDGDPISFLREHYAKYLPSDGQQTLFLHDLRVIDGQLARAINSVCSGQNGQNGQALPLGTKPDLTRALVSGLFLDGEDTQKRIKMALRRSKTCSF